MQYEELTKVIQDVSQESKGILAADESIGTIGKRFATIGIENNSTNRLNYRLLLATTPNLAQYISAVILFEETLTQKNNQGQSIAEIFAAKGITPGIKVDQGVADLANTNAEKITKGLDGLEDRLLHAKANGAKFAKWRNIYRISDATPSITAIKSGSESLARYAAVCQSVGMVPIIEPEILMDGDHSIDICAETAEIVLHELFNALFMHQVLLEAIILKPSMVTSGKDYKPFSSPEDVAEYTISVFRNTVPAAVPTINFLSGGQTPGQATMNLHSINNIDEQPWCLSFSYGRALQEPCLSAWRGDNANTELAQNALIKRAHLNSLASLGKYNLELE